MSWIPFAIALGAVLGALSRYYVTLFWLEKLGKKFPYGTFFINLTGALLIGLASTMSAALTVPVEIQTLIMIGFLGAYTTFSSYILDTANLFHNRRFSVGFFYWIGSPIVGFICIQFGIWIGQHLI